MGFFKDFKRDFAQAVNELMPEAGELDNEYDDEDMVNTFDDDIEVAPEDSIENLDDLISFGDFEEDNPDMARTFSEETSIEDEEKEPSVEDLPEAEIIQEPSVMSIDDLENSADSVAEALYAKEYMEQADEAETDESEEAKLSELEDELEALEALDDENMEENTEDALRVEAEATENEDIESIVGMQINLEKDVSDAISKKEEQNNETAAEEQTGNDDWEDNMADIETTIMQEAENDNNIESILTDDTTYITKGTVIKGNIDTDGGVDIIGRVEGDVSCSGKLILGGTIIGNVNAGQIYANAAKIEGEVLSEGSVKIGVGSVIVGNIMATSAVVAGAVNGDIDVQGPVIVDSTAVIMGNIKSRSVQINNGAVIEGFCSQCYSEIDVKSFFE